MTAANHEDPGPAPRTPIGSILASGLITLLACGLLAIPVYILAAIASFSNEGSEDVVYLVAFGVCAWGAVWTFERLMRRSGIVAPLCITVGAPAVLLVGFVAVLWEGVSLLGVVVGTPFFELLAAEVATVAVWALGVRWAIDREAP